MSQVADDLNSILELTEQPFIGQPPTGRFLLVPAHQIWEPSFFWLSEIGLVPETSGTEKSLIVIHLLLIEVIFYN